MRDRSPLAALLLIGLVVPFVGCTSSPSLTSISVTPTTMNFGGAGLQAQLTATGSYTHPGHPPVIKDITGQVNWASSVVGCVTVSDTGMITSGTNVCSNILVTASMPGFNGLISGTMTVNVTQSNGGGNTNGDVTSITIIPSSQTVATLNQTSQFIAIGKTSSGATVDVTDLSAWSSSNQAVASVTNAGLATALASGSTTITALFINPDGTAATGSATLTVSPSASPEPLASLSIIPTSQTVLAINQTSQFIAIGTTSTGITEDLTNTSTWTSTTPAVGTISPTGLVTSHGPGTTAIIAEAKNPDGSVVTGSASFTVSPSSGGSSEPLVSLAIVPGSQTAFAIGQTAQFLAIGTTGTGTTEDVTAQATWLSSNVSVGTIGKTTGLATAVSAGSTAITAEVSNPDGTVVTGSASFTVQQSGTIEPYVSIAILPASQTASSLNETAQFIAIATTGTGTTVDVTNLATWKSSDVSVGTIGATTGLATAVGNGATAITAILPNGDGTVVTGSASFTVTIAESTEPLTTLTIIPTSQSVTTLGETAQFIAIGTFSGTAAKTTSFCNATGTMQDCTSFVTWSSSDVAVGTISKNGLATGQSVAGSTAITAIGTNPDGTLVTGAASFTQSLSSAVPPAQATLGITLMGTGANNGLVTAPAPGTNTPTVINCSTAAGAVCSQPFPVGSTVILTAPAPPAGTTFGGWSANCASTTGPINPTGTNSCSVILNENQGVAAIFY